jgi:monoamine oxidase
VTAVGARSVDAVVVGAGLAGLAAAEQLHRLGRTVVVFEASGRLGGRCFTDREHFGAQHVELGGEFIDVHHPNVHAVVGRFGLHLDPVDADPTLATLVVHGGRRYRLDALPEEVEADLARYRGAVRCLIEGVDPFDVLGSDALDRLDDRSVADWLDSLALHPLARLLVDDDVRTGNMVEPSESSLAELAWDEALIRAGGLDGHERFRVREGNDAMVHALAGVLAEPVLLDSPVVAIDAGDDIVEVHTEATRTSAAYVVVACPLAAVGAMSVRPSLPQDWRAAIGELRYGRGGKIAFRYPLRWWRDDGWSGRVITDGVIRHVWEPTEAQPGPGGVLTIDVSADLSSFALGDEALLDELAGLFPGAPVHDALAAHRIDWTSERGLGGSYVRFGAGQVRRFARALREPCGRLILAGEHTDDFLGYLEGALRSGLRAARWVDAQLPR